MSKTYLDKSGLTYFWGKIKGFLNNKQDTLVSGTNIKTINNTSLLGNGNISVGAAPIGSIMLWPTNTAPDGWLFCRGQALSKTTYADLYAVIGNMYGELNNQFLTPDLQGYVPVGRDNNDTDFDTLGETGGSKYLQAHNHQKTMYFGNAGGSYGYTDCIPYFASKTSTTRVISAGSVSGATTGESGNLQPYIVLNYIIKYQ